MTDNQTDTLLITSIHSAQPHYAAVHKNAAYNSKETGNYVNYKKILISVNNKQQQKCVRKLTNPIWVFTTRPIQKLEDVYSIQSVTLKQCVIS